MAPPPAQTPKLPSLEDTISQYKNKFLIDLDDDHDESPIIGQNQDDDEPQSSRKSPDTDSSEAEDSDEYEEDEDDDGYDEDPSSSEDDQAGPQPGTSKSVESKIKNKRKVRDEHDDVDDDVDMRRGNGRNRKSKLPRDLAGLMGQANVSFAQGHHLDAIAMCQEIIRNAPRCSEPFISLAEYYEEAGDEEKAEQLYLIAAYLQPSDIHLWVRVAESATKRREYRLAATCYTKAIRADKNESSIPYHLRRCSLYEKLGDQRKALRGYENLISALGPDEEKFGLELARGIARIYESEKKIDACIRTLEGAFEKYANQLNGDDIGQLAHCYNIKELYTKSIDLIVRKCHLKLKLYDGDHGEEMDWSVDKIKPGDSKLKFDASTVDPRNVKFNFRNRCLLAVALIELGYYDDEIVGQFTGPFDKGQIEVHRSSLFEIASAYYNKSIFNKAKELLYELTQQRDSQSAPVWLLYSQCLKNLNEIDSAIEAYRKVLIYNPDHYDSRLALSNLLSVQDRLKEALEVTRQPLFTEKPVDIALLYQCCRLLEQAAAWDEYCDCAKALLLTDMFYTSHPREITCMITSRSQRTRLDNLRSVQREVNANPNLYKQKSIGAKLDSDSMIKVFLRYINILFHVKHDYTELLRICFSAYNCPAFECYESSIDFYTATACICAQDRDFTYNHFKVLALKASEYNQVWNMFSVAMSNIYQDLRHSRFCMRQFLKNPDLLPLSLFNGHIALMSGSYKHALGEYMSVFRRNPNDPLVVFCISLSFLSLSCQSYVSSKYLCIFQMVAFLHLYLELRGSCQEAMYNIGRVFHQLKMLDKAVIFYKRALEMDDGIFDVRREAAFNLALIYKKSQSFGLAYEVIKDNFTI